LVFMSNGHEADEFASSDKADDNGQEIDKLRKRVDKLENTVERMFQVIDAQIYPDEAPPEDLYEN
jgi:hypothetical protein